MLALVDNLLVLLLEEILNSHSLFITSMSLRISQTSLVIPSHFSAVLIPKEFSVSSLIPTDFGFFSCAKEVTQTSKRNKKQREMECSSLKASLCCKNKCNFRLNCCKCS